MVGAGIVGGNQQQNKLREMRKSYAHHLSGQQDDDLAVPKMARLKSVANDWRSYYLNVSYTLYNINLRMFIYSRLRRFSRSSSEYVDCANYTVASTPSCTVLNY